MKCRAVALILVCAAALEAQWIHVKLPGVPRNPDGSVNLKAPAPKVGGKPDFSGIWRVIRPANIPEGTGYAGTLDYWMAQGEKIPQNAQAAAVFDQIGRAHV